MHVTKQIPSFFAPWCLALEKSVGAVIARDHEGRREYLLLRHNGGNGHWDLPKGHVEDGETEEETMRREVREETGLTAIEHDPCFRTSIFIRYLARGAERRERINSGRCLLIIKKVVFYLVVVRDGDVRISDEHQNHIWLPYKEALRHITYDGARNVLRAAHGHYFEKHMQKLLNSAI
ncbi:MAG TPA: NUDIX domain-containing protein [Patescibacteria group bacterium]|nr:NUDIX domain-containing protein [Patescibacteria group bacterium]